jgi:hypothetical protein
MGAELVEVYWDARPYLAGMHSIRSPTALPPAALTLIDTVRLAVAEAIPNRPTALRVKSRGRGPVEPLRVHCQGQPLAADELVSLEAKIANALARGPALPSSDRSHELPTAAQISPLPRSTRST